ncbi:SAM-dependent methyltransferase, partial [Streptomyces albidoflavus]
MGTATRGTTNPNRRRRMDRWSTATPGAALSRADDPLAGARGYGYAAGPSVRLRAPQRTAAPGTRGPGGRPGPAPAGA